MTLRFSESRAFTLSIAIFLATFLGAVFFVSSSLAKETKFKDYPFEISKSERLVIQGVRGNVKLVAAAAGQPTVVRARKTVSEPMKPGASERYDALSFSVRREGGVVIVEPRGPSSRQEWVDWSRPGQPELSLEIQAPATSAEIHMHSGSVSVSGWTDNLAVSLQEGKVAASGGSGKLGVNILRGDVKIEKHNGSIDLESHTAKISVSNSEGNLRIHSFAGDSSVANLKGDTIFRGKSGSANLSKLTGALKFENGRGRIEGTSIDGPVRGVNDDGSINLQLAGEPDLSIETSDGAVTVKPPAGSGALLKLSTEEGAIVAPDSVAVPKVSGAKSVVARMSGSAKGVIAVRSKKGTIRVR